MSGNSTTPHLASMTLFGRTWSVFEISSEVSSTFWKKTDIYLGMWSQLLLKWESDCD